MIYYYYKNSHIEKIKYFLPDFVLEKINIVKLEVNNFNLFIFKIL